MAVSGVGNGAVNPKFLELFLALRLFCNNGNRAEESTLDADEHLAMLQQLDQDLCAYCGDTIHILRNEADVNGGKLLECRHLVCRRCISNQATVGRGCPQCASWQNRPAEQPMSISRRSTGQDGQVMSNASDLPLQSYPTKLRQLLSDIMQKPTQKWYAIVMKYIPSALEVP